MNTVLRIAKGKLLLCSGLLAAALFALHPAFTTPAQAAGNELYVLGGGGGGGGGYTDNTSYGSGGNGGDGGSDLFGNSAVNGDPGSSGSTTTGSHQDLRGGDYGAYSVTSGGVVVTTSGGVAASYSTGGSAFNFTATFTGGGTYDALTVDGGDGGSDGSNTNASAAPAGGNGGSAKMVLTDGDYDVSSVTVSGGNGGHNNYFYSGGSGGAGALEVANDATLTTDGLTAVTGGTSGSGTLAGKGGDATFTVNGLFASTVGVTTPIDGYGIKVQSGADGTIGGVGGDALLNGGGTIVSNTNILVANTLNSATDAEMIFTGTLYMVEDRMLNDPLYPNMPNTPNAPIFLNITAQRFTPGGAATIDITNLDATYANVRLNPMEDPADPDQTVGYFHVGTAVVSNGWHPTGNILRLDNLVSPDNTDFRVDTVQVLGKGRLELTRGVSAQYDPIADEFVAGTATIGYLDAHGAGLSILSQDYLTDAWADGLGTPDYIPMAVTDRADITDTALSVDDRNGRLGMTRRSDVALLLATTEAKGLKANIKHYRTESYQGDLYSLEVRGKNRVELSLTSDVLKAYAEARVANMAFLNQGSDLILSQGFGSALAATASPGWKVGTFGALSGGWSRYDTGSHVDVSGLSMLVGIGVGNDAGPGRFTGAIFFEAGWGNYDSYNSFSNGDVNGDGDTDYYGGGLLARYDFTSDTLKGLYVDFAARMGHTSTDFNTSDIKYTSSISNWFLGDADFDIDSMYYGLMAGVGYQWSITEKATLDLSAHFMWTHQESDSTDVYFDHVSFEDADSLRTRLGGRFSYAVSESFSPYIGAYWDYEFDGEAKAKVNGWKVDSPDLEGSTGVGELGLTLKPVADSGFSMDLGVQGYVGVREGVTGSLQLKYEF